MEFWLHPKVESVLLLDCIVKISCLLPADQKVGCSGVLGLQRFLGQILIFLILNFKLFCRNNISSQLKIISTVLDTEVYGADVIVTRIMEVDIILISAKEIQGGMALGNFIAIFEQQDDFVPLLIEIDDIEVTNS